ncbi:6-bladed beta-propeller [Gemmatimonadota bacterium]
MGQDTIYVVDLRNKEVLAFDLNGDQLFRIGGIGYGPGEFTAPCAITSADGYLYIADDEQMRISVFTYSGQYVSTISIENRPCEMEVFEGQLFVGTRSTENVVWRIDCQNPTDREPILTHSNQLLRDTELRVRLIRPQLTILKDELFVGLENKSLLVVISLRTMEVVRTIEVNNDFTSSYLQQFDKKNADLPDGLWMIPRAFISLSQWGDKYLLIQVRTDPIDGMSPTIIVLDPISGNEIGLRIVAKDLGYQHMKVLPNGLIAWTSYHDATVHLYKFPVSPVNVSSAQQAHAADIGGN